MSGLIILLLSAFYPWLIIKFLFDIYNVSLIDVYFKESQPYISQIYTQYLTSFKSTFIALFLYLLAIILAFAGIADRGASFFSGMSAMVSACLWIYSVDSLRKTLFSFPLSHFGTTLFVDIRVGFGAYIAIIAGIILIIASLIPEKKSHEPSQYSQESTPKQSSQI